MKLKTLTPPLQRSAALRQEPGGPAAEAHALYLVICEPLRHVCTYLKTMVGRTAGQLREWRNLVRAVEDDGVALLDPATEWLHSSPYLTAFPHTLIAQRFLLTL